MSGARAKSRSHKFGMVWNVEFRRTLNELHENSGEQFDLMKFKIIIANV